MMELILRISSDGTEHGDTAPKTDLSERRKASRETVEDSVRAGRTPTDLAIPNHCKRRAEGGTELTHPAPANGATLCAAIRKSRRVIRRIL
jgi:hypothetical protein